ncbi:hypothetical protein BU16DRAFT_583953 [Lophium mytilinum]|uniref:Uncharacterized protein n=1 Tax=Lophium mytilinum TaxID=390894 RepID=A0A6A6QKS3_9PEZI|nr:hypothetical protein BU16DRAFT_583953 [Lophium mytilinum]
MSTDRGPIADLPEELCGDTSDVRPNRPYLPNFSSVCRHKDCHLSQHKDRHFHRKYRQHLENVQRRHEQLAQSRERIVIERVETRSILQSIRPHRERAGNLEASFVTRLRQFCARQASVLPPDIDALYQEVQEARDTIGKLEDDFIEAQKSYNASEWRFIEAEDDFYQYDILEDLPETSDEGSISDSARGEPTTSLVITQPVAKAMMERLSRDLVSNTIEKRQLNDQFNDFREEEVVPMDEQELRLLADFSTPRRIEEEKDLFQQAANVVIEKLVAVDVRERNLRQEMLSIAHSSMALSRRASDPPRSTMMPSPTSNIEAISREMNESNLAVYGHDRISNRKRVGQWILDTMETSSLEKARFKHFLRSANNEEFDESIFEQILIQRWMDGSSSSSASRTGQDGPMWHRSVARSESMEAKREEYEPSETLMSRHAKSTWTPPISVKFASPPHHQLELRNTTPENMESSDHTSNLSTNDRHISQDKTTIDRPNPTLDFHQHAYELRIQPERSSDRPRSDLGDIGDAGNVTFDLILPNSSANVETSSTTQYRYNEPLRAPPPMITENIRGAHQLFTYTINRPSPSPPLTMASSASVVVNISRSASPMSDGIEPHELRRCPRGDLPLARSASHRRSRSESNAC